VGVELRGPGGGIVSSTQCYLMGGDPGQCPLFWNQVRARDALLQGCQYRTVGTRKLAQVTIRNLLWRCDPSGKIRDI
jgi:hypothetical protein